MKNLYLTILLFLAAQFTFAQGTRLLREPAISKDYIVFVYANDLWRVSKSGGDAFRLTSNEGAENRPHFSPDGKYIAFTAQYDGNPDIYVIPIEGGEPKRLTWHPGADMAAGWTPDGNHILFTSSRENVPTRESKFYKIPLEGGMEEALPIPRAVNGRLSNDARHIAYQQIAFWDPEWRNYRGGQAKPIWIVDMKDYSLKMTPQTDMERHTQPIWHGKRVFFLSERDYANNIWSFDPSSDDLKQETFHVDFDIKNLDSNGEELVYEQGGYLHILTPSNGQTQQLEINVKGDFHWARERWESVSAGRLTNPTISPTGQRALFEYRGEVITVPKENGDARNITQTSGVADRSPVWSPDGQQLAWFSDESGEYQLMIGDQEGLTAPKKIQLPTKTFYFKPEWSPDGKFIAYTDTDYNLWFVNVSTGTAKVADTERYAHPNRSLNPIWSPDSKWVAYARLLDSQFKAIFVYNIETGKKIQVTDGMADAISPVWDAKGEYLYFLASTNFGLNTGWLDMSSYDRPTTRGLYAAVLSKNGVSPFLPESDEEKAKATEAKSEDKKAETKTVVIDEEGLWERIVAVDIPIRDYSGLIMGPENHVFYLESVPNERGQTLHRYNFKDKKSEVFMTGVSAGVVSMDRKSILYQANGNWGIVDTNGGPKKAGDGSLKALASLRVKVTPKQEWNQIYTEAWRYQRDFLYVDNVHGAPWDDIYNWYKPWVDHVRHRSDMNYIVDILGGEVAVGHSYTSGGDFPNVTSTPIGLLGADYELTQGKVRIKKIYTGESWNPNLTAPLAQPGIQVKEGDYILEVNGKVINPEVNFYSYFEGLANKQVKLKVNSNPSQNGAKMITVVPIANENGLRNIDWVEGNRRKVNELSDGKLAYVYVPNTGQPGYTSFNRYYFAQQDKKGAVIDERNNGGGSAADYIVDIMARDLHGYFNSRANDRKPFTTPMAGIWGPKVMLINERAGSGGDLLPYLFNKMEIGPMIGTQTWGGLVGTWDTPPFIDGGRMVAPRGGFFDVNGEWAVEGVGVKPDIHVEQTPKDVIEGRDPQLERAVQEALKLLETEGVELKPEPKAPIRYFRPEKKN
ncbi:Tol biopolymer transport system, periplasmic component-related protein [Belliella baltica DSM 15883]|uniref:Tricorn protease homolog n=1 Tax=Belliella baltica (strain DSM 15883 / CIP 108006 / LMG 21964 / BA134) TaxID=866536 RepID=I3Z8I5_BELBD|nr:S41 family peptidase [Belliella baltica]AFL85553.1 Tol biopolymer transport system, periplasmic component-related protein [Belliella baltica DSM 15883]